MRSIRGRSCNSIAGLVFRVPVTCAPISHITHTPQPLFLLTNSQHFRSTTPSTGNRPEMKKKRKLGYTHTRPQMHMIARMQEILYSQRTSSLAVHPIPSPLPPFPPDPPPPQKQQGTKKDREPTGSVMILTPSHSLQHAQRQHHCPNPTLPQNKTKNPLYSQQPSPPKPHCTHTTSPNNATPDMEKRKNKLQKPTRSSSRSPRTSTPHSSPLPLHYHHHGVAGLSPPSAAVIRSPADDLGERRAWAGWRGRDRALGVSYFYSEDPGVGKVCLGERIDEVRRWKCWKLDGVRFRDGSLVFSC